MANHLKHIGFVTHHDPSQHGNKCRKLHNNNQRYSTIIINLSDHCVAWLRNLQNPGELWKPKPRRLPGNGVCTPKMVVFVGKWWNMINHDAPLCHWICVFFGTNADQCLKNQHIHSKNLARSSGLLAPYFSCCNWQGHVCNMLCYCAIHVKHCQT